MLQRVSHESVVFKLYFKHLSINYLKPRRRWQVNIKMDFQEVECGGAWTASIWLRTGTRDGFL